MLSFIKPRILLSVIAFVVLSATNLSAQNLASTSVVDFPLQIPLIRLGQASLAVPDNKGCEILINLKGQRLQVFTTGRLVLETAVSTGKPGFETPAGSYEITEKTAEKISNIYHLPMPYFMRLDWLPIGIHYGRNPGHPASDGCIRVGSRGAAEQLFNLCRAGTQVIIQE